jgi:hypothetical protein
MWGAIRASVALLTLGMGQPLAPPATSHSGMTLVVRLPEGKKTKLPIAGTPAAPTVVGSAEIEYRGGRSRIKLTLNKLPDPRRTGPFNTSYVAWVVRDDHSIENLAEIPMKKQNVTGTTAARTLGLIITAEPYGAVRRPSSTVIAELALPRSSDPQLSSTTITYEGVPDDFYDSGLSDPSAPTPDSMTPLPVLAARRAVAIARKVEGPDYARPEFSSALTLLDSLERTWTTKPKDEKRYVELARETARRADLARELAMTRAQEARNEADRQRAEEDRQRQEAAQQAGLLRSAQRPSSSPGSTHPSPPLWRPGKEPGDWWLPCLGSTSKPIRRPSSRWLERS